MADIEEVFWGTAGFLESRADAIRSTADNIEEHYDSDVAASYADEIRRHADAIDRKANDLRDTGRELS